MCTKRIGAFSQNVSVQSGGMGCHGAGNLKELRVFKALDQASPTLRAQACIGMHYPTAVLVKRKAGQKPLEYFKLRMKDIVVASIDLTLGNGDSPDTEILTLKFAEFLEEYTPQSATGAARPTVSAGYNAALEKNCKTP
ncbi:MAG: type VI secretion system tube protein Hcp [Limnobacter sp.]|nr:type VI secretion system tube protein Hcp [Limnobacter sp.]